MDSGYTLIIGVGSIIVIVLFYLFRPKVNHLYKHGYLGIFLGCLVGNTVGPASFLSTLIGGRYYPAWLVGFVGALGAVVAEVLNYNAGALGQLAIKDKSWFETLHRYVEENGFFMIVGITAIPNPVMNAAALISGALHYPFLPFLIASFIGNWLQFFLTALVGRFTKRVL